ncbi:MAG: PilX N-terminal domain-containing pilus assembly protein [Pseudomonadales bacterium]
MLTIAGVTAVQTTTLEERMARNSHDTPLAFQSAEAVLRQAEDWMRDNVTSVAPFDDTGANGLWTAAEYGDDERWDDAAGVERHGQRGGAGRHPRRGEPAALHHRMGGDGGADEQPGVAAELVHERVGPIEVFRITARGVGGSANAQVLLQSTYGMIF